MSNKQKLEKAIKLVEEGNIPDYFEFMKSEVGENDTLSLLQNTVIEGKESVGFAHRLILLARTFFDEQATKDRKELLEGLAKRYEKRLNKKLEETLFQNIEVDLEYTTEGTSEKHVETYFIEKEAKPTGDFEKLLDRYLAELKSLLILGDAGSGKTVLLLKIGKELVKLAKKDAFYPLPVLVNLASWRNEEKDFKTWLASVLVFSAGESGISKDYAKDLVAENNLLLLLDGLDEIPEEHRNSCLEAFKQYATEIDNNRTEYPKWVICSRKNEYKQAEKDAFVQASVLFKPLTDEKIQTTLHTLAEGKNMTAKALMEKITANPTITTHFRTAFEFHLALKMANEDNFRADNLVEDFIDKELKKITPDYPKAKQYLSFLAKKMKETKKGIVFELIDMQPPWLEKEGKFGLVIGIVTGLFFGFFLGLVFGLVFGLIGGLIGGLNKRLTIKLSNVRGKNNITAVEIRQFDAKQPTTEVLLINLKYVLFMGIVMGIVWGIVGGIVSGLGGLGGGLFLGIIWGIVIWIVVTFFVVKRNSTIRNPYQRLYAHWVFDFFLWTFVVLIALIAYATLYQKLSLEAIPWWHYAQAVGFGFVVTSLDSPLLKHFILRFLLWQEGKIPLRWVSLLNKLDEKTGILEKDGGQWRFRHQLLQDALGR